MGITTITTELAHALQELIAVHADTRQFDQGPWRPNYVAWVEDRARADERAAAAIKSAQEAALTI